MSFQHHSTSSGGDGRQPWGPTDVRASAAAARDADVNAGRHAPQSPRDEYGPHGRYSGVGSNMRSRYEQAAARQAQAQAQPSNGQGGTAAPPRQYHHQQHQQYHKQQQSHLGAPPGRVAAVSSAAAAAATNNSMSEYEAQQSKLAAQSAHRNYQLRRSNRNQAVQHEGIASAAAGYGVGGGVGAGAGVAGGAVQSGGGENNNSGCSNIMEEALRTSHAYGRLGKPPPSQQQQQQQQQGQPRQGQQQPSAQSRNQPRPGQHVQPRHLVPQQSSQQQQQQQQQQMMSTPQRAQQSTPQSSPRRHQRRPSPTHSVYSDPEPVLDDDPSVGQPFPAQQMHQSQAQAQAQQWSGRDPPGNGAHPGSPSRTKTHPSTASTTKGHNGKYHHHAPHHGHDDVTATPTPSTMTDQTKTTATLSMSTAGGGGGMSMAMPMPPYRQHQPHPQPHSQHYRPRGSPQRRRPSHPQPQQQQQHSQRMGDQWPPQAGQEQQQQQEEEYFDQGPQQQMQETNSSSNRPKKSHIQWDEGVVQSAAERRGSSGGVGDGGRRGGDGGGGGEDISTAASGHSQFRSRFFRAAAMAAHRDGKIQVDGVTTSDAGQGSGGAEEAARQQVAPQAAPRAPVADAGNFRAPAPVSPRNDINASMATDAGVADEAPRQMAGRSEKTEHSPAIAAPSPMRVPMRRAIDPEPSPSPKRSALQPPEQHHVTFQAPDNGPQSILRSPTRSPAQTKASSEAGASSLHQHMLNQDAIRRTGSYSTSGSTDKSSVARLVAKLNSVKRDDPASALAAIDAIIKSERHSVGGGSGTQDGGDEVGAATSDVTELKANVGTSAEITGGPTSQDPPTAQPLFPDVPIGDEGAAAVNTSVPRTDEEEMKSLLGSSEDDSDDEDGSFASTVSSITNPTYLGNLKTRQGSDNGGLMIQQQYQHWQQQQMVAPEQQPMTSDQHQGAGLPPLAPQTRPSPAATSTPQGSPRRMMMPQGSPGRMIMTPPKVPRTKADPSASTMPASSDPLQGQEVVSPVMSPAGSFPPATSPMSPGEESRTSPIARMRAAKEQQDKRQQSRANVHRAVASSRDALDALDEQLQQQRQRQVDSGLSNGYSRDALDALDEQQARTSRSNRDEGDTPSWAREPQRKSSSDHAFDAAAQRYLSSATSPLVRSVSTRPTNGGPSRAPKWQSSATSSSRNDRSTFRASSSRSFEDPYIDQTKAVTDAFAGVDISFEEDGGLTEENMNRFDSLQGASNSRYAQSDIGVGKFYAYDDTAAKSPLDIFYERRASASPTKTPAALRKMKARFGPNYSASGEALEISPKSNGREISETTSDFFPSMELEKSKIKSSSFDAEMDAILAEFDQRPAVASNNTSGKPDKPEKQKNRSSKRFFPKKLFRNPRASKAAADF